MGMAAEKLPPKAPDEGETEETVQFNFRIPKRLLAALDAWLDDMNRGRRLGKVTRAEVLRAVLERDVVERPMLDRIDGANAPVKVILHHEDGREIVTQTEQLDNAERVRWFFTDALGPRYRGILVRQDYVIDSFETDDAALARRWQEVQPLMDQYSLHAALEKRVARFDKEELSKEMARADREIRKIEKAPAKEGALKPPKK